MKFSPRAILTINNSPFENAINQSNEIFGIYYKIPASARLIQSRQQIFRLTGKQIGNTGEISEDFWKAGGIMRIIYLASNRKNVLPKKLPEGRAVEDVLVLRNGKKLSGRITRIRSRSLGETILVMNGKNFELNKIAVIKFAARRK